MNVPYTVILLVALVASPMVRGGWVEDVDFGDNPGNLQMSLYVPNSVDQSSHAVPLVVALHGCSQNIKTIAEQSGWNKLADEHQFMVLYPGQRRVNNGSNCFNWFESEDIEIASGETGSIANMVYHTVENYPVDHSNVLSVSFWHKVF